MSHHTLLKLKGFDIVGQLIVALGLMFILRAVSGDRHSKFKLLYVFYAVGGWQIFSTLLTCCVGDRNGLWKARIRTGYHIAIVALGLLGILFWNFDGDILVYSLVLFVAGSVLGVLYFFISITEAFNLWRLTTDIERHHPGT